MKQSVLLLTDVFPCSNYSGGIASQRLCRFLLEEKYNIHCALLKQVEIDEKVDGFVRQNIKTIVFKKPSENTSNKAGYLRKVNSIGKKIVSYINKENIRVVWCPLQGESLLRLLRYIQKHTTGVRIVVQIWDPIEWVLHELKYNEVDRKNILKLFDIALESADYILAASKPMCNLYRKKFKTPCKPLFLSFKNMKFVDEKGIKKNNTFTIVLSGQTYAKNGIRSFVKALDKMKWTYGGKRILIKYFGPCRDGVFKDNKNIINGGFVSQEKLIEEESAADLLYCPYFFDDGAAYKLVSQQSYPSKVITYIPAQTPILIHANKDCPVYKDFLKYKSGFLLESLDVNVIVEKIKQIINVSDSKKRQIINNANRLFDDNFTHEKNKKVFMNALGLKYTLEKKIHILEVNNVDLPGKRWNGYDIAEFINNHTPHTASQLCTYKTSNNKNVIKIFNDREQELEYKLLDFEANSLSVHSCLSCSSPALLWSEEFKNADVVHLHLVHNMKLSLFSLIEICSKKPTIITIHDPWNFTGRCVYYGDCDKYLTGCKGCPNLKNLFPLKYDTCNELWKLKGLVYANLDVDYVVTTKFMSNLFHNSPLTKGKKLHVIPFGINVDEFYGVDQKKAKKRYNIPDDHMVLFHRAQRAAKGTNYFEEALKYLDKKNKITVITCSETGLLDSVKNKFNIIDLGEVDSKELRYTYNACDIFIMPSFGESFGMMAIEAMSCEKPIIVFNNTALPSVTFAPDCGIAVENSNSKKLAEAIQWLIDDDNERLRRGRLGRKLVKKNYNLEIYNDKIRRLYEDVAEKKPKDFYSLLNKNVVNNDSVKTLRRKLNQLTEQVFPKKSLQRKNLLYSKRMLGKVDSKEIKYSDINVQLLLDQYNKDMFRYWREVEEYDPERTVVEKINGKIKTFIRLLVSDREKLREVIKEKIGKRR